MQKSIKQVLSQTWSTEKMVNYCLKASRFEDMGDYYLEVADKPKIDSTIYYSDEFPSPGTSFNVFRSYNISLNGFNGWDKRLHNGASIYVYDKYFEGNSELKTFSVIPDWDESSIERIINRFNGRKATEEETKLIQKYMNQEVEKYEKRLKTYYKRYGNKVSTHGYWADK